MDSEGQRRRRAYELTAAGRKQLLPEARWQVVAGGQPRPETVTCPSDPRANVFRSGRAIDDIDEELASHLDDAVAGGRDPAEARRAFGSPLRHREDSLDARLIVWLADIANDLRFGVRMLRRSPGFTILAAASLTLGIGANAAVFSWIEGILLRPFPLVAHQERLLAVTGTIRGTGERDDVSWPDFLDLQQRCTLFDAFIADKITGTTLSVGDRAERAAAHGVRDHFRRARRPSRPRASSPAKTPSERHIL